MLSTFGPELLILNWQQEYACVLIKNPTDLNNLQYFTCTYWLHHLSVSTLYINFNVISSLLCFIKKVNGQAYVSLFKWSQEVHNCFNLS